jgi:uncharacterized membrane protein
MLRTDWKLKADVARWQEAGYVTGPGADAIIAEISAVRRGPGPAAIMGLLGAVLFGFAAMSFVAANWQHIPRSVHVIMLLSAMGAAYGAAGVLNQRGYPALASNAVLAGAALFGANIMLVGQMYHLHGSLPEAELVWALGALASGVLCRSNPSLMLALILMCLWGGTRTGEIAQMRSHGESYVYWPFLLGWAAVSVGMVAQKWERGIDLCALVLAGWIVSLGFLLPGGHAHPVIALVGLLAVLGGVLLTWDGTQSARTAKVGDTLVTNGALITGLSVGFTQFDYHGHLGWFITWATVGLALSVAAIWSGIHTARPAVVRLGYAAFSFEVLAIYFRTIGTLLGSAGFFLVAGLMMVGLAALALRFEKTQRVSP